MAPWQVLRAKISKGKSSKPSNRKTPPRKIFHWALFKSHSHRVTEVHVRVPIGGDEDGAAVRTLQQREELAG